MLVLLVRREAGLREGGDTDKRPKEAWFCSPQHPHTPYRKPKGRVATALN